MRSRRQREVSPDCNDGAQANARARRPRSEDQGDEVIMVMLGRTPEEREEALTRVEQVHDQLLAIFAIAVIIVIPLLLWLL